ncbi:hypothetical protein SpCBS45565_g02632 [Spizellomyces sp. 'palustris']|nr:hypothetical protein SpCBS45565_g02632 [Spizellomyces sp. 'palustris']
MTTKLIVFVVGPPRTGKTAISNHIAELTESLHTTDYHPTQGVRILEFDRQIRPDGGKEHTIACELWDCSGDPRFHPCWPVFSSTANCVILVTSPELRQERELDTLCKLFPTLTERQMVIFAHNAPQKSAKLRFSSGMPLSRIPIISTTLDNEPEAIRNEFDALLAKAFSALRESRYKEEENIMA